MTITSFDISVSTSRLILILLVTVYSLVFTPYILYYARRFWSLNTHKIPFIHKRHPRLVVLIIVLSNIYIIILKPITDFLSLSGVRYSYIIDSPIGFIIIMIRVWLLFYDYNRALHKLALKWSTLIAKQSHPPQLPWTFRHKWMGNVETLFIITALICIVIEIPIVVFMSVFGAEAMYYIDLVLGIIFIIFMAHLIFNVHSCRDQFFIQKEFKLMMIWTTVNILVHGAYHALFAHDSNLHIIVSNIWITMICYVLCYIQTRWVIQQYNASNTTALDRNNSQKRLKLQEVLQTKDGFDVFASHLIHEISIENLFFVFEVMQTKNQMLRYNLVQEEDIGFLVSFEWEIMDQVRRTSIIVDVNDLRKKVRYIISQYITEGSEYWVNLSAATRSNLMSTYNALESGKLGKLVVEASIIYDDDDEYIETQTDETNQTIQQIEASQVQQNISKKISLSTVDVEKLNDIELNKKYIVLFDDAIKQIMMLLQADSLNRFYRTDEYKTFIGKQSE